MYILQSTPPPIRRVCARLGRHPEKRKAAADERQQRRHERVPPVRPSLHDDGHRRDVVGEPRLGRRVQWINDRVHMMQRLERRKWAACDVVTCGHDVEKAAWNTRRVDGAEAGYEI